MSQPGSSGSARLDFVQRFAVEQQLVRGQFVRLGPAWLALLIPANLADDGA